MSLKKLSDAEKDQLNIMFSDLKILFEKNEITVAESDNFLSELKSSEVKSFINNLIRGTKPETALRESFFAGQSLLSRYLASDMIPEVNTGDGFVDYKMFSGNRFILLELKPLFDTETRESSSGRELVKLKQKKLDWKNHTPQILKYIKQGGEYIVITDLKDWYFFDDTVTAKNCQPFFETSFHEFEKDFGMVGNVYTLIEKYKYESIRESLDKEFFKDLKVWLDKILEIDFDVDEKQKVQLALGIINKFIFIQTLHDHSIIEFRWLLKRWKSTQELWGSRQFDVLEQFFQDTIKWFFRSYDTELFINNEIAFLKKDTQNIKKFYNAFKTILGITYLESDIGGQRGIMQYNFKFIDEDIFGKAYETYLANVRHDEGIYYTPSYITQFIVENTVGKKVIEISEKIKSCLASEDFETAEKFLVELTNLKVIDPACGSGSFLIKAFRVIWNEYQDIRNEINTLIKKIDVYDTLSRKKEIENKSESLQNLKKILGFESNRDLVSKLLLRHIHGNDLDPRAVSTTKVNLWLEAIKQSPKDFVYEKLPEHTNRILPYLDMNIVNGDAVVSLPNEFVFDYLKKNNKDQLEKMSKLRLEYIEISTSDETRSNTLYDLTEKIFIKKLENILVKKKN